MSQDLSAYLLEIPAEPVLVEGPADVLEAMAAAGYQGEWWMKIKPLNEGQIQVRYSQGMAVAPGVVSTDLEAMWRYNYSHMIIEARLPLPQEGKLIEFIVEEPGTAIADRLLAMHPNNAVLLWLQGELGKLNAETETAAATLDDLGNLYRLASSTGPEPSPPQAGDAADEAPSP